MLNIKILKDLLSNAKGLEYGMSAEKVRDRAHMIFKNIFGEDCIYITRLYNIQFEPRASRIREYDYDDEMYRGVWEDGKRELVDLIELAFEEYGLFINPKSNLSVWTCQI